MQKACTSLDSMIVYYTILILLLSTNSLEPQVAKLIQNFTLGSILLFAICYAVDACLDNARNSKIIQHHIIAVLHCQLIHISD